MPLQIPRKNVYLFDLNGNATTSRWYPESPGVPESITLKPDPMLLVSPRGRVTGVRIRCHDEVGAVTSIRLQMYSESNGSLSDDHLVYDTGVLTDGVDGITIAESATAAFWLDNLAADRGAWGNGSVHDNAALQRANSRENLLRLVLTQVAAAGANQYAVAFDTLEDVA